MLETLACLKIQGGLHDLSENSGGPIVIPSTDQKEAPLNSQRFYCRSFLRRMNCAKGKTNMTTSIKNATHAKLELRIPIVGSTFTFIPSHKDNI